MPWEAWFTLGTIALVTVAMATNRVGVDTAMVGGLTILLLMDAVVGGGILGLEDALAGFAHPALLMIGALFVLAAGLQETGAMELVARRLLGRPRTLVGAQLRMMVPVAVMSGFMNNTPIVAMYLPIIGDWARKLRISPSKLYMPLSFAAILGGKITLIGTASNIVVMGLYLTWLRERGLPEPGTREQFWAIAAVGIPATITGIAFIAVCSRWLLPERRPAEENVLDARRYEVEMDVAPDAPIVGATIEEAGLRHLPGLFLTHVERGGETLPAVSPTQRLLAGDRLAFTGILASVVDLRKIRGLVPATDQVQKLELREPGQRTLVEAVVSRSSPLVGRTVRRSRFRTTYNAAIIAVHRGGEPINAKIGDITLQAGDTLLLETHAGFLTAYRNSGDFFLVSQVEGSRPIRHERAWVALAILGLLVAALTLTTIHPAVVALSCAGLMVATRCLTGTVARRAVSWQVLLVLASALGMGAALNTTGAATAIADGLLSVCGSLHPTALLGVMFLLAAFFAQLITNNGAAALMFPIVMATVTDLNLNPEPFVYSLMIGAGSTFVSPVTYQTNLMVYGAGGYRFLDFARLGLPLTLAMAVVVMLVAPLVFPFYAS